MTQCANKSQNFEIKHVNSTYTVQQKVGDFIQELTADIRIKASENVRQKIPSPHSELLLGLTLGINDISKIPTFNDVVRTTGTIHVIVVSGYNISLVFTLVIRILGSQYRTKNLISALVITLLYAVISGFDPPVIRAWIMGSIAASAKFYGRIVNAAELLLFSALTMLVINPAFLFSLSFQLSFLATLSLVYFSDISSYFVVKVLTIIGLTRFKKSVIVADLTATLSAQILVWPLISYHFEQVSIISPVVNAVILWTIPLATILGGLFLLTTFLPGFIGEIISYCVQYILMVPLDIFVRAVYFFANFELATLNFKITALVFLLYFIAVLFLGHFYKLRAVSK